MVDLSKPVMLPVRVSLNEEKGGKVIGKARKHILKTDLFENWGGCDTCPTPLETFAFSLGACFVSTARRVADKAGIPINSISAKVEGEIDVRKAMGRDSENRVGFPVMKVMVDLDSPLNDFQKKAFIEKVAILCPVVDSVDQPTPVEFILGKKG